MIVSVDDIQGHVTSSRDISKLDQRFIMYPEHLAPYTHVSSSAPSHLVLDVSCREQGHAVEMELVSTKEKVFRLEEEKARIETALEKTELSLSHAESRAAEVRDEKAKLDEEWLILQQKSNRMEEEVIQARAHVELFRQECQEAQAEVETMRTQYDKSHEEDRLSALREELELKHNEAMEKQSLAAEKATHHHRNEAEKLIEEAKLALSEEKDAHETHIQQLTQRHEIEHTRQRDEFELSGDKKKHQNANLVDSKHFPKKRLSVNIPFGASTPSF